MCDVPLSDTNWDGFSARRYDFDFRQLAQGLPGYRWAFPCLIGGEPHVNVGIYSFENSPPCALRAPMGSPPPAKPAVPPISIRGFFNSHGLRTAAGHEHSVKPIGQRLNESLTEYLAGLTARPARRQAFPIHFYRPGSRFAAPHVLLVGDAAGVDPLMGEGISLALDYGALAATAAQRALKLGDFSGVDYQRAIDSSWLGKKLRRLYMAARLFYGPRWRLWFALAEHSSRLRTLGIRWYNGIDDWDRRSGWEAVRALLSWRSLSERAAALATGRDGAP
jgi:2-polyprenyl-6-methoxyphenol hydroxylase-like FAD-dependent oxidoreductase